jgi:hypothetical protein
MLCAGGMNRTAMATQGENQLVDARFFPRTASVTPTWGNREQAKLLGPLNMSHPRAPHPTGWVAIRGAGMLRTLHRKEAISARQVSIALVEFACATMVSLSF